MPTRLFRLTQDRRGATAVEFAFVAPIFITLMFAIVAFGAYGNLALGSAAPVSAALPLLPLVTAADRLGAGSAEVSINILPGLPSGISGAAVKLALGEPTAGSSYAAIGPIGTTLHTAQTRVLLTLQLAQFGIITGLNLSLYVETGPATATLSAIGCSAGAPVDPAATLGVTPGAVDGWIGTVTDAALTNLSTPVSPATAVLTNLGLVQISGRAHATISNTTATSVPFTQADIAAGTMKSTSTTDYASSLLSSLFGNLQLSATTLSIATPVPFGVAAAIGTVLQADLLPIDQELSGTLAALGITIGDADTWVRAVRCGQGALVN